MKMTQLLGENELATLFSSLGIHYVVSWDRTFFVFRLFATLYCHIGFWENKATRYFYKKPLYNVAFLKNIYEGGKSLEREYTS